MLIYLMEGGSCRLLLFMSCETTAWLTLLSFSTFTFVFFTQELKAAHSAHAHGCWPRMNNKNKKATFRCFLNKYTKYSHAPSSTSFLSIFFLFFVSKRFFFFYLSVCSVRLFYLFNWLVNYLSGISLQTAAKCHRLISDVVSWLWHTVAVSMHRN